MLYDSVEQAKDYVLDKIGAKPDIAVVMGSGLSGVDEILAGSKRIPYASIPCFPIPKVEGHRGQVTCGKTAGKTVFIFEGRVHYYEGHTLDEVTFCARVVGQLGTRSLILTNASGVINPSFHRGQLMLITDHLNFMGVNPLRGPNENRWGPRFVDLTDLWDPSLRLKLRTAGELSNVELVQGVYAAMAGPSFETPAEIRMLRLIGADCVGMSTVPEAIVARHMGLKVAGISMLANAAAGLSNRPVNHEEVLETAALLKADVAKLFQRFFEIL